MKTKLKKPKEKSILNRLYDELLSMMYLTLFLVIQHPQNQYPKSSKFTLKLRMPKTQIYWERNQMSISKLFNLQFLNTFKNYTQFNDDYSHGDMFFRDPNESTNEWHQRRISKLRKTRYAWGS